jgi:hypothetical protein
VIFGLLSLTSLKLMFSSFIHLLANDKFHSSLRLNKISLCKYHIFLIHSLHLGCFHSMDIANGAINMGVQVPLE